MRFPSCALPVLAALLLVAAPALAQEKPITLPPAGAHVVSVGNATLSFWVGTVGSVDEDVGREDTASALWFGLQGANESRLVAYVNLTPGSTLTFGNSSLVLDAGPRGFDVKNASFQSRIADAGRVNQSYTFTGEVYEEHNGTLTLVGPVSGSGAFVQDVGANVPTPTPPQGIPRSWLIAGALVVLVGGVGLAYTLRQRAIRRKMNEAPRRSHVMRDLAIERELEKARTKDPEKAVQIQQEIRQAETVREKRRELQILEAKRDDALKTMDLLKKRHESGALSKHQLDNMLAKKQQDLTRLEAEIAAMEAADRGAAS